MTSTGVLDPVCGMTIDPADASGRWDYKGQTYYFCHPSCLARFKAAPDSFLSPTAPVAAAPAPAPTVSVVDPVCAMTIDPATAAGSWDYKGQTYYFCSPSCLARFKARAGLVRGSAVGLGSGSGPRADRQRRRPGVRDDDRSGDCGRS
jgi:Cu+-exporting ATPase